MDRDTTRSTDLKLPVAGKRIAPARPAVTSTTENIDPATAALYLKANIGHNRPVSQRIVKAYAEAMRAGLWILLNDDVCFDEGGHLINGQHRLMAVIESGVTIPVGVKRGLSREAFKRMDTGQKRDLEDVLSIMGYEDARVRSPLSKRALVYVRRGVMTEGISPGRRHTPAGAQKDGELEVAVGSSHVDQATAFASPLMGKTKRIGLTPTQVALGHVLYASWHPGYEDFIKRLVDRDFAGRGDPANLFLDRVMLSAMSPAHSPNRMTPGTTFGYLIMALNTDARGRTLSKLQWTTNKGEYPQPTKQVAADIARELGWPPPAAEGGA